MNDTTTPRTPATRSQKTASEIAALLRARNPVLWIATREESRVERYLLEAAAAAKYAIRTWDCGQGFAEIGGKKIGAFTDPGEALDYIADLSRSDGYSVKPAERCAWIMRDLPDWLQGPIGMTTCRKLANIARARPSVPAERAQAIIVLSPSTEIPPTLAGHVTVIDWPMPDRAEISAILDAALAGVAAVLPDAAPNGTRDAAIDAAVGLSGEEAAACYGKSLVQLRRIDPAMVASEKKRVIARERVLEWIDPIPGGMDAVGGLASLKSWLKTRASAYSPKARAYGLPSPKGVLLVGISGCGKSLSAKAVATAWKCPLLRLDLGAIKSKFVGESEANLRKVWKTLEAIGRSVLWIDEIEKSLAGATQGAADGGVSSDALGSILSWMQDRTSETFVIATANDVTQLPPELLRKGRFDEMFFVDLPTKAERAEVTRTSLRQFGRNGTGIDAIAIADATNGFTGAEIAAIVPDALFAAFNDGEREPVTADILAAARQVTPLSKTAGEKIAKMRAWGKDNARRASGDDEPAAATATGRQLDL